MTPPIFNLDDEVKTTNGTRFKISQIWKRKDGSFWYAREGMCYHPASSLRLVEELKICDYVQIVGLSTSGDANFPGTIGQIERTVGTKFIVDKSPYFYPPESLRKLTPEEVQAHRNPGKPTYEYPITPAKDFDDLTLRDIARMSGICKNEHGVWISTLLGRAHNIEERLSAIEERLDIQGDRLNTIDLEKDDLRKRLAFVEKIQRDQDDLIGRAIRDGVVEILDFRRKA